ncbi:orotate phosphoribosyltransferase [Helicobacter canis]|uniref:Orotate phosphoribosyltransferase n=1 Tax=Helicobacter canis NCTC 12740 TaxID=1357399 RepID=V8CKL7_9HELI|nr:orotate phosphoribosyltransferase [Helicobacter canis]ETD27301.1 orotate phosphoribosyltransferase [Helicobacter canis NCTC 12740]
MQTLNIEQIYKDAHALLEGHFLLSSGNHSAHYLQSAKVLENPQIASKLGCALAAQIKEAGIEADTICSPALGGILAGYELARALGVRFIFTERVDGVMQLRRGFEVASGERVIVCEDIITTGGSALESARCVEFLGAKVVAYAGLANRGFCVRANGDLASKKPECRLPDSTPLFALGDFIFTMYDPKDCPLCAQNHSKAIKPGSRGN